jgi:hypothetical protein
LVNPGESQIRSAKYAGTKFIIGIDPASGDAPRVANQIKWVLTHAKWELIPDGDSEAKKITSSPEWKVFNFDGILIEQQVGADAPPQVLQAAEALSRELNDNKITAVQMPSGENFANNIVAIRIGQKPNLTEAKELDLQNKEIQELNDKIFHK